MKKVLLSVLTVIAMTLPAIGHCEEAKASKAAAGKVYKIADVYKHKDALDKKVVTVKGKVVKVSSGIMDRNWIHIQDGTGHAVAKNNDLTVTTTQNPPAIGKEVTVTGTLAKSKDFGAGYFYDVIIEKATIK